jgi:hypothetical protein
MKQLTWLVGLVLAAVVVDRLVRTIGEVIESAARVGSEVAFGPERQATVMPEDQLDSDDWVVMDPTDHLLPEDFEEHRVIQINPGESLFPT